MLQDVAAGLAYHSAGLAELAAYFSPPPQQQQHTTSSSGSQRVDVGFVHGLLGAGGGNGHLPPCSSGSCHAAGVASGAEGRGGGAAVMSEARKARRLASNRESARRSRVRRRRQLDELSACASELRATNQRLIVELNRAEARYAQVARENARLREEARRLREKIAAGAEGSDEAGSPDDGDEAAATAP